MTGHPDGSGATPVTRIAMVAVRSLVRVTGVIRSGKPETIGTSPALRCVLADGSGEIDLLFLGQSAVTGLEPGRRCTVSGRASACEGRLVIWNPRYELAPVRADADGDGRARVLMVDDDPAMCRVMEVNLTARGYRVDTAGTAASALPLVLCDPDLIIVDLGVPDAHGFEIIAMVRDFSAAPVLAIAAHSGGEMKRAAIAAGASEYLIKPFPIATLLTRVEAHLPGRGKTVKPAR